MSLPLDLIYNLDSKSRRAIDLNLLKHHECKDELIIIHNYRSFDYYKRIGGKFVFARKLLPREIDDWRFMNDKSFRSCTVVGRMK